MKTRANHSKIEMLFDRLHYSMSSEDYDSADLTLSRLSKYLGQFDDDLLDYYNYAKEIVEDKSVVPLDKLFDEEDYYASEYDNDDIEQGLKRPARDEIFLDDIFSNDAEDYDDWYDSSWD